MREPVVVSALKYVCLVALAALLILSGSYGVFASRLLSAIITAAKRKQRR